jgi:hypothetical protein
LCIAHNDDLRIVPDPEYGSEVGSDDENVRQCNNEDFVDVVQYVGTAHAEESPFEIEPFPSVTAGTPIPGSDCGPTRFEAYQQTIGSNNDYAPFISRLDWEIAQWAKTHKLSSSAVTKLLEIEGVRQYQNPLGFE